MSIKWDTLKTAEDLELERYKHAVNLAKAEKNRRLAEYDYLMLKDSPPAPEGVEEYRQALRDIKLQEGFPFNVVWPTLIKEV